MEPLQRRVTFEFIYNEDASPSEDELDDLIDRVFGVGCIPADVLQAAWDELSDDHECPPYTVSSSIRWVRWSEEATDWVVATE